jgi:amidase
MPNDAPVVRLGAERAVYHFDAGAPPAVAVDPGTVLVLETRDAYDRRFAHDRDVARYLRERGSWASNPVTGPIFVRGVGVGDGLDVTIEEIRLGGVGYVAAAPGIGVLGDESVDARVSAFEVRGGALWFEGVLPLPLRPMVGVIGVAPAAGRVPAPYSPRSSCWRSWAHGWRRATPTRPTS